MTKKSPKRPITVTHITSGDLWAGAEVQVYNLCKALNTSDEVAVTAVVFNPGILHDKLVELSIPVTLADESSTSPMGIAKAIASHCRSQGTDIVHTHGFKENVLGIVGKELARIRYSVRTVHGNPEHKLSWKRPHKWLVNRLDIWLGRTRQQAVIAVSSQLEEALQPLFPGKVHKIFNFIDVQELRNSWLPKPERTSTLLQLGIVARLVPVKRVDLFIKIIHQLFKQGVDCKGIILGDGPLKPELQNLCVSLGIEQRIDFRGFVDPVAKDMLELDALIITSDHEGLPMTLLEGLALGLPVYAHDTGGISEVLQNCGYGALVRDQDANKYVEAIKNSEYGRKHLSSEHNVIEHLKNNFDKDCASESYTRLYASISGTSSMSS